MMVMATLVVTTAKRFIYYTCPCGYFMTNCFFSFFKKITWFIGCVGSSLLRAGFSLLVASGGYASLQCVGFSLRWLLLLQSTDSTHTGFSSCSTQPQQLWCTGLVAPWHGGSSRTRARTHVSMDISLIAKNISLESHFPNDPGF